MFFNNKKKPAYLYIDIYKLNMCFPYYYSKSGCYQTNKPNTKPKAYTKNKSKKVKPTITKYQTNKKKVHRKSQ